VPLCRPAEAASAQSGCTRDRTCQTPGCIFCCGSKRTHTPAICRMLVNNGVHPLLGALQGGAHAARLLPAGTRGRGLPAHIRAGEGMTSGGSVFAQFYVVSGATGERCAAGRSGKAQGPEAL